MRIIAGTHRSRPLKAPRTDATRPTTDRARETLFNVLVHQRELTGLRILDLYAGTGALAFESLSRGAASAVLVEHARAAREVAMENAKALGFEPVIELIPTTVQAFLDRRTPAPFDIIFADPPYDLPGLSELAGRLLHEGWLSADGILVLEHRSDTTPSVPDGAVVVRELKAGEAGFTMLRAASAASGDPVAHGGTV